MAPDVSMNRWLATLTPAMQQRFVKIGLLDGNCVSAMKPLSEYLADWEAALTARDRTSGYV